MMTEEILLTTNLSGTVFIHRRDNQEFLRRNYAIPLWIDHQVRDHLKAFMESQHEMLINNGFSAAYDTHDNTTRCVLYSRTTDHPFSDELQMLWYQAVERYLNL